MGKAKIYEIYGLKSSTCDDCNDRSISSERKMTNKKNLMENTRN